MADYNYVESYDQELEQDTNSVREHLRNLKSASSGYNTKFNRDDCIQKFNKSYSSANEKVGLIKFHFVYVLQIQCIEAEMEMMTRNQKRNYSIKVK